MAGHSDISTSPSTTKFMTSFTMSLSSPSPHLPPPSTTPKFSTRLLSLVSKRLLSTLAARFPFVALIYAATLLLFFSTLTPSLSSPQPIPNHIWTYNDPSLPRSPIASWHVWSNVTTILPHTISATTTHGMGETRCALGTWGKWVDTDVMAIRNIPTIRPACQKRGETPEVYILMNHRQRREAKPQYHVNSGFIASIPRSRFIWAWFNELNIAYTNFGSHHAYAKYLYEAHGVNETDSTGDEAVRTVRLAAAKVLTVDGGIPMPRGLKRSGIWGLK
ncbi:hypothetical protein BC829DRAFT_447456 [Chytridium lagenaria]|nr:hypothetical protein BC829DRAFT_447456 [Chytridium lagenaria]